MIDRVEIISALQMNTAFHACRVDYVRWCFTADRMIDSSILNSDQSLMSHDPCECGTRDIQRLSPSEYWLFSSGFGKLEQ